MTAAGMLTYGTSTTTVYLRVLRPTHLIPSENPKMPKNASQVEQTTATTIVPCRSSAQALMIDGKEVLRMNLAGRVNSHSRNEKTPAVAPQATDVIIRGNNTV